MSLGNWETIAFNKKGQMCGSQFDFNKEFYATIYKDQINFHHRFLAKDNSDSYYKNIFCSVKKGIVEINNCKVISKRINKYAAIFVICEFYNKDSEGCKFELYTGLGYIKKYPEYDFQLHPKLKQKYINWLEKQSNVTNGDYCQKVIEYMNRL